MSTFVPIETTIEGIAEEEELIIAVEAFVETVSKTAWNQLYNEIIDLLTDGRDILYSYIPFLVEYSTGERNIIQDTIRLLWYMLVAFATLFIFSPSTVTILFYKYKFWYENYYIEDRLVQRRRENAACTSSTTISNWSILKWFSVSSNSERAEIETIEISSDDISQQRQQTIRKRRGKRNRDVQIYKEIRDNDNYNNNVSHTVSNTISKTVIASNHHHQPRLQTIAADFSSESTASSPYHTWHSSPVVTGYHPLLKPNEFFLNPQVPSSTSGNTSIAIAPCTRSKLDVNPLFRNTRNCTTTNTKPSMLEYNRSSYLVDSKIDRQTMVTTHKKISSTSSLVDWDITETTDEDRFQKLWPTIVASGESTKYHKLVLPPACRRRVVVVTNKGGTTPSAVSASSKIKTTTTSQSDRRAAVLATKDEEDNPYMRIQNYIRQIWILIRSILSYDYSRASTTLFNWLQGFQRIQAYRRTSAPLQQQQQQQQPITDVSDRNNDLSMESTTTIILPISSNEINCTTHDVLDESNSIHHHHISDIALSEVIVDTSIQDATDVGRFNAIYHPVEHTDYNEINDENQSSITEPFNNGPLHQSDFIKSHFDVVYNNEKDSKLPNIASNGIDGNKTKQKTRNTHDYHKNVIRAHRTPLSHSRNASGEWENLFESAMEDDNFSQSDVSTADSTIFLSEVSEKLSKFFDRRNERTNATTTRILNDNSPKSPTVDDRKVEQSSRTDTQLSSHQGRLPVVAREQSLAYFFDTADSPKQLQQLTIDSLVPDKHGYVLGEQLLLDARNDTPLLVFVNTRSGPQQGHILIAQFRRLLNPVQVWDLADGSPEAILESFAVFSQLRILVCGGDGTVAWIISALEKLEVYNQHDNVSSTSYGPGSIGPFIGPATTNTKHRKQWPPIAILPLGTGNDLARIHGWGGGYNNESLISILEQISESYTSLLDRWEVTITDSKSKKKEVKNFFNYLGVGADAQAALQVHYLRESVPEFFFSRLVNKAMYGLFGAEDIIKASSVHTRKYIKVIADGVEIPLPDDSQGIILLNIDSYAGGVPLWSHGTNTTTEKIDIGSDGDDAPPMRRLPFRRSRSTSSIFFSDSELPLTSSRNLKYTSPRRGIDDSAIVMSMEDRYAQVTACDLPSSCQDGFLEIVSIRGAFHLGQIKVGLSNAQRLCQCREVTIIISNKVAVQVDGEPWRQNTSTITIKRKKERATMLHRSTDDGGVEMEMSKLLDWAEERRMINSQVHTLLMKEFSRRIENKKRQHRDRDKDNNNNIMSTLMKKVISTTGSTMVKTQSFANTSSAAYQQWQGSGGVLSF